MLKTKILEKFEKIWSWFVEGVTFFKFSRYGPRLRKTKETVKVQISKFLKSEKETLWFGLEFWIYAAISEKPEFKEDRWTKDAHTMTVALWSVNTNRAKNKQIPEKGQA